MEKQSSVKKILKISVLIIAIILLIGGYIWYYVPFSDSGVKAGILNNIKHKGIIFKTYEGELIQSGFRPGNTGLQSNEFNFSVKNEALAKKLMEMSGQQVRLHYKEYFGTLPWRGYSKFIVDSILQAQPYRPDSEYPPITE